MPAEARLRAVLDAAPSPVLFWWRDDDAGRDHQRLATLLELAQARAAPVALAVVPEWLTDDGAQRIRDAAMATVVQHGIAHVDHAVPPAKKIELGGSADRDELARRLLAGRERLAGQFGDRFLPALVPPWNRIAPDLVMALPAVGFCGLSVYGPRRSACPVPGLRQVNTHLDLVAWRDGARAFELPELLGQLTRLVEAGTGEPIGILSHHLVMDGAAFATLDRLLALVLDHRRAKLVDARLLFGGD